MKFSGEVTHYFRDCGFFADFFRFGNENSVWNVSRLRVTTASKELPCLLLKPLMMPVLPSVNRAFNWSLVSSLPAFSRNTWQSQAGLSHLTTFL